MVSAKAGRLVSFYSYKGGVGRTLLVADVGVRLSAWGFRVLCIDWDLEAPGLDYYFGQSARQSGVVEWITNRDGGSLLDMAVTVDLTRDATLDFVSAGGSDNYAQRLSKIDWTSEFLQDGLAQRLLTFKDEAAEAYDFVLLDSRTGVTDSGGITSVLLPDLLVMVAGPNEQNLRGVVEMAGRVKHARAGLLGDHAALPIIPVLAKLDAREEYQRAQTWRARAAETLFPLAEAWMPASVDRSKFLERLAVPYVSFWSLGEAIPALEEAGSDPETISYSLSNLAALVANDLRGFDELVDSRDFYVNRAALGPAARSRQGQAVVDASSLTYARGLPIWRISDDFLAATREVLSYSPRAPRLADPRGPLHLDTLDPGRLRNTLITPTPYVELLTDELMSGNHIVVLSGEAGSGKTTVLQQAFGNLATQDETAVLAYDVTAQVTSRLETPASWIYEFAHKELEGIFGSEFQRDLLVWQLRNSSQFMALYSEASLQGIDTSDRSQVLQWLSSLEPERLAVAQERYYAEDPRVRLRDLLAFVAERGYKTYLAFDELSYLDRDSRADVLQLVFELHQLADLSAVVVVRSADLEDTEVLLRHSATPIHMSVRESPSFVSRVLRRRTEAIFEMAQSLPADSPSGPDNMLCAQWLTAVVQEWPRISGLTAREALLLASELFLAVADGEESIVALLDSEPLTRGDVRTAIIRLIVLRNFRQRGWDVFGEILRGDLGSLSIFGDLASKRASRRRHTGFSDSLRLWPFSDPLTGVDGEGDVALMRSGRILRSDVMASVEFAFLSALANGFVYAPVGVEPRWSSFDDSDRFAVAVEFMLACVEQLGGARAGRDADRLAVRAAGELIGSFANRAEAFLSSTRTHEHAGPLRTALRRLTLALEQTLSVEPVTTFDEMSLGSAHEDETLEFKAAAWLDLPHLLRTGESRSFAGGLEAIAKTVCGMLNSSGGLVVVGIGETNRLSRDKSRRELLLQVRQLDLPTTTDGDLIVVGLEGDYGTSDDRPVNDWDSWARSVQAGIGRSLSPDPFDLLLLRFRSLRLSERYGMRTLGLIEVAKPSDRWFYHENRFYVRRDGRNEVLEAESADAYRSALLGR